MFDTEIYSVVVEILNDLKAKIEFHSQTRSDIDELNEKLNDKFMRVIDSSDSCCSSTSTLTTSSDEDNGNTSLNSKKKLNKKPVNKKLDDSSSDEDGDDDGDTHKVNFNKNQKYLKTKDEITIDDLPPLDMLNINLDPNVKLVKIGQVKSIVNSKLVVIQSIQNLDSALKSQPLDEESILFDSNRKALGKIYETFGPVASPFYSLRFNPNEIVENGLDVSVDSFIYYAPESDMFTKFVFNVEELRKMKGSDASWNHDNEPPSEFLDYSDDEAEKLAKKNLKTAKHMAKTTPENEDEHEDDDEEEKEEGEEGEEEGDAKNMLARNNNKLNYKNRKQNKFSPNNQMKKSHSKSYFMNNNNNYNNNRNNFPKLHSHQSFSSGNNYDTIPPQPFMLHPQQYYGFNPYLSQNNGNQKFLPSYNPFMPHMPMYSNQVPPPGPMMMGYYPGAQIMNYYPDQQQAYQFQSNTQMNPNQNQFSNSNQTINNKNTSSKIQSNANNNNNNCSNIVDKRFIQNSSIIKKSF